MGIGPFLSRHLKFIGHLSSLHRGHGFIGFLFIILICVGLESYISMLAGFFFFDTLRGRQKFDIVK